MATLALMATLSFSGRALAQGPGRPFVESAGALLSFRGEA